MVVKGGNRVDRPNAPVDALQRVVTALGGQWYPSDSDRYTSVQFKDDKSVHSAYHLVNMLPGWRAVRDPHVQLSLHVYTEAPKNS